MNFSRLLLGFLFFALVSSEAFGDTRNTVHVTFNIQPLSVFDLKQDLLSLNFGDQYHLTQKGRREMKSLIENFRKSGFEPWKEGVDQGNAEDCIGGIKVEEIEDAGFYFFAVCRCYFLVDPLDHTRAVLLPGLDPAWDLLDGDGVRVKKRGPFLYRVIYNCGQNAVGRGASEYNVFVSDMDFKNKTVKRYFFYGQKSFSHRGDEAIHLSDQELDHAKAE